MPSLRDLLSEVLSGPQRGAKTTLSSVQNLRELLGQSFFPKEYDSQGREVNAGIAPFFGLPKGGLGFHEGIAARPPQGIVEIPMKSRSNMGVEKYRDPFIHLPDRNLTLLPQEQDIGEDAFAHADLISSYRVWLKEHGFPHNPKEDLWRGGKKAPIQGEIRHSSFGRNYGNWKRHDNPQVNIFTTKQQSDPEMLARLRERYPKSEIRSDGWDPMNDIEIRQAKKKATRKSPGRKVEKPYSQRRRSGR